MSKDTRKQFRLKLHEILHLCLNPDRTSNSYRLDESQITKLNRLRSGYLESSVRRLFFDIETSPNVIYSFRIGFKLSAHPDSIIEERKIICISYKWEGSDQVHRLTWDENKCDKKMLVEFLRVANTADEMIGHNGDRFDIKWLRTRCIFHRIPMFPKYRSLDTLKKAKSSFYFNSNRLGYIATYLGVGSKFDTGGFNLWVQVMNGDLEALELMGVYCDNDVVILEDVFQVMKSYITPNVHEGVLSGKNKFSCPKCASENADLNKVVVTAAGTIKRLMDCGVCNNSYEISNRAYIDLLKFKNNITL